MNTEEMEERKINFFEIIKSKDFSDHDDAKEIEAFLATVNCWY